MTEMETIWPQWKIVEVIGAGQFGKVYKVVREEAGFSFYSAVKEIRIPSNDSEVAELRSSGLDDQAIERYFESKKDNVINEIKLMESLKSSDGIVSIEDYDYIKRRDSFGWILYIRMELLESLSSYRNRHDISVDETVKIGMEIASALMDCGKYQIIHRDIKWDNIFRSEFGHYKLGDFGVSKQLERTSSAATITGTAMYMAPEIIRMEAYDLRVDIYALGLVLYRLLNRGRFPFISENPTLPEIEFATTRRLRGDELPIPCDADPELGEIINKACAFRKEDRYQTAQEFYNALEEYRSQHPAAIWDGHTSQPGPGKNPTYDPGSAGQEGGTVAGFGTPSATGRTTAGFGTPPAAVETLPEYGTSSDGGKTLPIFNNPGMTGKQPGEEKEEAIQTGYDPYSDGGKTMPLFQGTGYRKNPLKESPKPEPKPEPVKGDDIVLQQYISSAVVTSGGSLEITVEDQTYQVEIPAGITEGESLVIPGAGEPGSNGGEAGNIKICIHILQEQEEHMKNDRTKKPDKSGLSYLKDMHVSDEYIRNQLVTLEERKEGKKNLIKILVVVAILGVFLTPDTEGAACLLTIGAVIGMIVCAVSMSNCKKQIRYLEKEREKLKNSTKRNRTTDKNRLS